MLSKIIQAASWVGLALCLGVFVWFVASQGGHEPYTADNHPEETHIPYRDPLGR